MANITVKKKILDALNLFYGKLKEQYVTGSITATAATGDDTKLLTLDAGRKLQGQIDTLNSNKASKGSVSWMSLAEATTVANTDKYADTYLNRNISSYITLYFQILYGDYFRQGTILNRASFILHPVSMGFTSAGTSHWVDVHYVSETRVRVKSDVAVTVWMFALYNEI